MAAATSSSPTPDNNRIREVVKATGNIVTIAGTGTPATTATTSPATAAQLNYPDGRGRGRGGNVYIADAEQQPHPLRCDVGPGTGVDVADDDGGDPHALRPVRRATRDPHGHRHAPGPTTPPAAPSRSSTTASRSPPLP